MERVLAVEPEAKVVGNEANGGFLLGCLANGPAAPLAPLMPRDGLLPLVAPPALARAHRVTLAYLVATLPVTAADRLQGIVPDRATALLRRLSSDAAARADFFAVARAEHRGDLGCGCSSPAATSSICVPLATRRYSAAMPKVTRPRRRAGWWAITFCGSRRG